MIMTKEQIQEAHNVALEYLKLPHTVNILNFVQIGMQMAISGEVLYNEDGSIIWID